MKSYLYYFIGAGALSLVLAVWKYRHKILKEKYNHLQHDYASIERAKKLNKEANLAFQKVLEKREEQTVFDLSNSSDFWYELRSKKNGADKKRSDS